MISTLGVIIIAVGVSVCVFVGGAVSIILILRANDRRRRSKEEVARQFSAGQRGRLSVGSTNYSHVTEPRTNLRRSTHLPYGVVSEGWAAIPSQESIPQYQKNRTNHQAEGEGEASSQQKRRRSLRASFSARSFSIPKTRRQKKIQSAVPLRAIPRSPLSAITERSGTNTTEASPSGEIAELPSEVTPKTTPEKDENSLPTGRPVSLQWPLITTNRGSHTGITTVIAVPTSRKSSLVRMNSTNHSVSPIRPSLGERSVSMASTLSIAPEGPLPPLPSIAPNQWPAGRRSRLRFSAASVDTIGSSVLGGWTSPSQTDTDLTSTGLATPIDLNPTRHQAVEREGPGCEPATVITTGSPRARHATKYGNGRAGHGSFQANRGQHASSHITMDELAAELGDRDSSIPPATGPSLSTKYARNWESYLLSRASSVRSHASPSLPVPIARTGSGYRKGTVAARHSMYEQDTGDRSLTIDPAVLRDTSGNPASPIRRLITSRPASIASENPFHWDRNSLQIGPSSSLRSSPGSQSKGHKRQNCIRISNISAGDTSCRASKLPQMKEESEDLSGIQASKKMMIPGLSLLEQGKFNDDADSGQGHVDHSAFLNGPRLEKNSKMRPNYSRAQTSESMISCKLDSDVFSNSRYDPNAPNMFSTNSTSQKQWPLTPTAPRNSRPQATPPSLKAIQEPYDPDSPTLPIPTISSATLFARALPLGTRVSGVQGPRNIPTPGRSSRAHSPTPTTARSTVKLEDLRRSVATLRRMNADVPDKRRTSQMYRDNGLESTNSLPNVNNHARQGLTAELGVSIVDISTTSPISAAPSTILRKASPSHPQATLSPSSKNSLTTTNIRLANKSRSNIIVPSPSTLSAGTTSIWEDASVHCDSPEPDLPTSLSSSKVSSPRVPQQQQQQQKNVDMEAYENFIGQQKDLDCGKPGSRRDRDKERESRLTSPQGKGLGLMGVKVQAQDRDRDVDQGLGQGQRKVWGTPGSLYDGEGFLKD
ncbi:hypothetical protein EPUS_01229 [Endocarpon pusillum Z07020]|uniref:Uncharacterized protein n=1 Tax=Endocarpon pusillum (strain Z07020 / HMAS-L-300199) TaxID=1263415 RepID=U1GTV9_ENDPU|nr:uncharacterized protein EPUS_01229 [Endocarpon pusillum Z07020]ERF75863.1 hypothetical protein EPUS_01229 [Endocarpon pusillum Z07020]